MPGRGAEVFRSILRLCRILLASPSPVTGPGCAVLTSTSWLPCVSVISGTLSPLTHVTAGCSLVARRFVIRFECSFCHVNHTYTALHGGEQQNWATLEIGSCYTQNDPPYNHSGYTQGRPVKKQKQTPTCVICRTVRPDCPST